MSWILGVNPISQILAGGLVLGAFFMATDYSTSPVTKKGKVIFAIGCGLLTIVTVCTDNMWKAFPLRSC